MFIIIIIIIILLLLLSLFVVIIIFYYYLWYYKKPFPFKINESKSLGNDVNPGQIYAKKYKIK